MGSSVIAIYGMIQSKHLLVHEFGEYIISIITHCDSVIITFITLDE